MSKSALIFFLIIFQCMGLYSNDRNWYLYEIDSLFYFEMPSDELSILDTVNDLAILRQFYTIIDNSSFAVSKVSNFNEQTGESKISMPKDSIALCSYYNGIVKGFLNAFPNSKYVQKDFINQGLIGRSLLVTDSTDKPISKTEFYFINHHLYMATYTDMTSFRKEESKNLFQSIRFNSEVQLEQHKNESKIDLILDFLLSLIGPLMMGVIIWGVVKVATTRNI